MSVVEHIADEAYFFPEENPPRQKLYGRKLTRVPATREMVGQFKIPTCAECKEGLVRFRRTWVCRFCFKFLAAALPGWTPEKVSLIVSYPNRAARRRG